MDMSYPDSRPPFMPAPYGVWNRYPVANEQFHLNPQSEHQNPPPQQSQQQPPVKRARLSEENSQSGPSSHTPMNSRMPVNHPVSKGTSNIFFKTRVCAKFRAGTCRNGENCNFAHGVEDLRQPPPNWQELVGMTNEERSMGHWDEDQKIIHRMKLCKKFYIGEECPYGERCNFLHEDPSKFREDSGRYRESSAISIGTTSCPPIANGSISNQSEANRAPNNTAVKPVYWKTKLCTKFETTGHCPFGDKCHFAHGQSELHLANGRVDREAAGAPTVSCNKPQSLPINEPSLVKMGIAGPIVNEEGQGKRCLFKWPKKINRIYADWIDDLPLEPNLSNQVES